MNSLWVDSPEYLQRIRTPFKPSKKSFGEVKASIPKELFERSTCKSLFYVIRDVLLASVLYRAATNIDTFVESVCPLGSGLSLVFQYTLWPSYWIVQSVTLAGWWCLGHEAGHGALSSYEWCNTAIGFLLHTPLFVPYFSWRSTHSKHHKKANSVESDENYVPQTRTEVGLPEPQCARPLDYSDALEDSPLYTLLRLLIMQLFGWQLYLTRNTLGSPRYPPGTNHFFPSSPLFKPRERHLIYISNAGLTAMSVLLLQYTRIVGFGNFFRLYFIPYLLANHWIVLLTFLHHSDPTIPHYRQEAWTWFRGALATVDRPLLGHLGRIFLHNVSHDHVAHHLFPKIPFYNQPKVTAILRSVLQDDYNYDSTNTARALYRSFTNCCFIENEGSIVFYKNRQGKALRIVAGEQTTF